MKPAANPFALGMLLDALTADVKSSNQDRQRVAETPFFSGLSNVADIWPPALGMQIHVECEARAPWSP